ncbi:membrane protein [Prevotella herbatica]|uniref:Membrane protein n=1 Tax=Prevotella herbatica TaxID=2801997 RepID=A0ABM7NX84_9BACT|nr:LiaF domain-containing protein [Prevotella herbatica]BCS85135.1 membrane protein [Prevotella herbatica]
MERSNSKKFVLGTVFIAVGVIYLLSNLGLFPEAWKNVIVSWQSLILLWSAIAIYKHHYVSGLILAIIGIWFLMPELSPIMGFNYSEATLHATFWPVIIIAIGLLIIFNRHNHHSFHHNSCRMKSNIGSKDGKVDYNLVMNGIDEIFLEPVFYGGEISTIMGGAKLDLRRTTLPEGDTTLKISSICGGVTLLLPLDWNVKVNSDSILGGFGDHRRTNGVNSDRRLIIDASFILGGGSIE